METGCRRLHRTPRRALRGRPLEHGCQDLLPASRFIMAHLDESRWSGLEPLPSLFENSSSGIELNTKAHAATHRELSYLDRSVINLLKTEGLQVRIFNDARPGSASSGFGLGPSSMRSPSDSGNAGCGKRTRPSRSTAIGCTAPARRRLMPPNGVAAEAAQRARSPLQSLVRAATALAPASGRQPAPRAEWCPCAARLCCFSRFETGWIVASARQIACAHWLFVPENKILRKPVTGFEPATY